MPIFKLRPKLAIAVNPGLTNHHKVIKNPLKVTLGSYNFKKPLHILWLYLQSDGVGTKFSRVV